MQLPSQVPENVKFHSYAWYLIELRTTCVYILDYFIEQYKKLKFYDYK